MRVTLASRKTKTKSDIYFPNDVALKPLWGLDVTPALLASLSTKTYFAAAIVTAVSFLDEY